MAYSAQTKGSNPGARRICLGQGQRGKKVADSIAIYMQSPDVFILNVVMQLQGSSVFVLFSGK